MGDTCCFGPRTPTLGARNQGARDSGEEAGHGFPARPKALNQVSAQPKLSRQLSLNLAQKAVSLKSGMLLVGVL